MLPTAYPFRELLSRRPSLACARIGRETPGALDRPIQFRRWRMPMLFHSNLYVDSSSVVTP
jgi:hypothetical protein